MYICMCAYMHICIYAYMHMLYVVIRVLTRVCKGVRCAPVPVRVQIGFGEWDCRRHPCSKRNPVSG